MRIDPASIAARFTLVLQSQVGRCGGFVASEEQDAAPVHHLCLIVDPRSEVGVLVVFAGKCNCECVEHRTALPDASIGEPDGLNFRSSWDDARMVMAAGARRQDGINRSYGFG